MVADRLCVRWAYKKRLSFFGCILRNYDDELKQDRFLGRRWAVPGSFSRRTLLDSSARSMFHGGKRCK